MIDVRYEKQNIKPMVLIDLEGLVMKVVALSFTIFLIGCATQPLTPPDAMSFHREVENIFDKNYEVGSLATTFVGDAMVRVKNYNIVRTNIDGVREASAAFSMTQLGLLGDRYQKGARFFPVTEIVHNSTRYIAYSSRPNLAVDTWSILVEPDSSVPAFAYLPRYGRVLSVRSAATGFVLKPNNVRLEPVIVEKIETASGLVNFEIIYSGSSSDSINLLYREYTPDDQARPAFSQALVYDKTSDVIRFRSMVIRVLEANSQQISYIVESDGLDAAPPLSDR